MENRLLRSGIDWPAYCRQAWLRARLQVKRHWYKLFLLLLAGYLLNHKDLSIDLELSGIPTAQLSALITPEAASAPVARQAPADEGPRPMNTSLITGGMTERPEASAPPRPRADDNLANTYSNMTYSRAGIATDEPTRERVEKRRKQLAYVERFADVARSEMKKYGIPASITLAQGLLESNVGESRLARKNNNHFGVKCFSRKCAKGHCSNFTDDHHKDFFRIYKNSWESYRAHSLLLKNGDRYGRLFKLDPKDYRAWAHGLKKAGYATDKHYAEKLINLIDDLELDQYDR